MVDVNVTADHITAERLQQLAELYEHGQASLWMRRTLHKLLAYEADRCRAYLADLRQDLATFEEQYGWSSEAFHRRFQAGQTDDRMDYVEWASLVHMAEHLEARLRLLTGEDAAP